MSSTGISFFRVRMFLHNRTDTSEHKHMKEFFKITAMSDKHTAINVDKNRTSSYVTHVVFCICRKAN